MGDELGDRSTHRVAERDGAAAVEAEHAQQCGGVVGAVLEREGLTRTHAAPVSAVVEGHHTVVGGERRVGGEEVEVCADGPAVQQQHDGGIRAPRDGAGVAYENLAALRQEHHAPGRQRRRHRCGG